MVYLLINCTNISNRKDQSKYAMQCTKQKLANARFFDVMFALQSEIISFGWDVCNMYTVQAVGIQSTQTVVTIGILTKKAS